MNSSDEFRILVTKLKFISSIKKNQKIDTKTFSASDNNWSTTISRTIQSKSRNDILILIEATLKDTYILINSLTPCKKRDLLIENIIATKSGIENLKHTYNDDQYTISTLESFIIEMDITLDELTKSKI